MWTSLAVLAIPPFIRRVDGIGGGQNLADLAAMYSKLKTTATRVEQIDKAGNKDGAISAEELTASAPLATANKKDALALTELKSPELKEAEGVLKKIAAGKPLTKDDVKVLNDAWAGIQAKLTQNGAITSRAPQDLAKYQDDYKLVVSKTPHLGTALKNGPAAAPPGALAEAATLTAMVGLRNDLVGNTATPLKSALYAAIPKPPKMTDDEANTFKGQLINPDLPMQKKIAMVQKAGLNPEDVLTKMTAVTQKCLQVESSRIYQAMGGDPPAPQTTIVASGDGSQTAGLFGDSNKGIGLFSYNFSGTSTSTMKTQQFSTVGDGSLTTVHLNVMGIDLAQASRVEIKKGNTTYAFKTVKGEESSYTHAKVDNLVPSGATKNTPEPGMWTFKDGAVYNEKTRNITFPDKAAAKFSVMVASSGDEELQVMVSVVKGRPSELTGQEPLALGAKDNFRPDHFTIDGPLQIDAKKLDKMAEMMKKPGMAIDPADLTGGGIGMKSPSGQVVKDPNGKELAAYDADPVKAKTAREQPQFKDLRYTEANVDIQNNKVKLAISSFVDPVRSNLDDHFQGEALTRYKEFVKSPVTNNDMLSALRTFALAEKLQGEMIKRGVPPEQAKAFLEQATVQVGGKTLDYDAYKLFKANFSP